MTIIDFRLRPPFKGFLDMIMYANAPRRDAITARHGMNPAASAQAQSIDLLFEEMDDGGVTKGVVMGRTSGVFGSVSNRDLAELVATWPDRFIGVPSISNLLDRKAAIREIQEAHSMGLVGVNVEPGLFPIPMHFDDARLYPIYAYCEDNAVPLSVMGGGNAGPDISYSHPEHVDRVARDFPDLQIAVTHGGWPWVHEILHVAFRRGNVWLSPDQYLCNMPGTREYIDAANGFLSERFLYASSYPFTSAKEHADWFKKLPIKNDVMDRLLSGNALRFLKLR